MAALQYRDALRLAGYLDVQASMYATGYAVRALQLFRVGPGFPRLLERDLPPGVGDVRYTVALAACQEFEVSTAELHAALTVRRVPRERVCPAGDRAADGRR
jgi:hypothetical protein